MDYIDLYQIHRADPNTPFEETMEALHDLVKSGKVRYIGASTMYAWQFQKMQNIAEKHGWTKFITMQNQYNLMYREEEREMIPYCQDTKVGIIPWSPLAGGRLTHPWGAVTDRNKVDEVSPAVWGASIDQDLPVIANLQKVAEERGVSMAQEALAWMLSKPYVTAPIVGTTDAKHVEEAVTALDIVLDASEVAALEAPYTPHAVADLNGYLQF
jgi:aryl-alcohol dehydrogenase-like predicted oxidoreductase